MNLFDEISSWPSLHARHKTAPLLPEREQYLASMLKRGVRRKVVRSTAAYLIHIVRLLGMTSLRKVELDEIEAAAREWAAYDGPLRKKLKRPGAPFMFVRVAQSWLRFHGQLATRPPNPFQHLGEEFAEAKRNQGLSSASVDTLRDRALTFLRWFGDQHQDQYSRPGGTVVFDFRLGRGRDGPKRFLGQFEGILQTDGYAAYNQIGGPRMVHAACWSHARRQFSKQCS
jgi:Transposase IS66 family